VARIDPRLREHRDVWDRKPGLRMVYAGYHRSMLAALPADGPILEIGGGSGNFLDIAPGATSVDLTPSPWVHACCDAHELPFADAAIAGIAMLDVLHHLARPSVFFSEAMRVLRPGGRLAMIEPGMTPLARPFYTYLHHEPVDMTVDPLADQPPEVAIDPFQSNQAIPSLLFDRTDHRKRFEQEFPDLRIVDLRKFSFLAYPLSGGFKRWSLLPGVIAPAILKFDELISPLLGPVLGFRIGVVLERA
tara:strand:+ start:3392 stop:4132 length:741 start_codon:yes stop_codon:yes gene_type:complete